MGIQGLLPFLSNSTRDAHISEFENEFVAIDAYCWLHKGIYSCAFELAMKKPTTKYVTYCMRYIEMLLHFKVKPILVFDGRHLSSKSETEKKRREDRKKKYLKGKELMRAGKVSEGRRLLGESVDVTHELVLNLMKECHKKNIDCIVAPYEADAQLAFLSLSNTVKCIITEDSDLLVYGCERVMFKMDTSGRGKLIEKTEIHFSLSMTPEEYNEDLFRYMCILSGCDYLPSLPSIGLVNALKFVKMLKGNDIYEALPKLPIYIGKMNVKVTPEYLQGFKVADNTFKHQIVYNPFLRAQVPLRPVQNDDEIVGTKLPDDMAFQLAIGNVDPISMKKLHNFDPDKLGTGFSILWKTTLLPNATPRTISNNPFNTLIEAKKRQREQSECDIVASVTSDLKKQRVPFNAKSIKNFTAKKTTQIVSKTGFVFDPVTSNAKKSVPKPTDESKLLKSRYFLWENKDKEDKKETCTSDRKKDESYEDYLQRLYDEYFPLNEGEVSKEICSCENDLENSVLDNRCSVCNKCSNCCTCSSQNADISESQKLGEYIKLIEEHTKAKEDSSEHFLLDEISKTQNEESERRDFSFEESDVEESKDKILKRSSSDCLTFNFTQKVSVEDSPRNSSGEANEKENTEECGVVRSPSPVFKVQKESRILSNSFRLDNIPDTDSTPTSVYFSSDNFASEKASSTVTPKNHGRKMSLSRSNSLSSKAGKNSLKNCSTNRTLFQFGFKKERRSENGMGT